MAYSVYCKYAEFPAFLGPLGGARLVRLSTGGVARRNPFVSVAVNDGQTGIPRV